MRHPKKEPMVCTSDTGMPGVAITRGNNPLRDTHVARALKDLCGNRCSFPLCLGKAVQTDEAANASTDVSDDLRATQTWWTSPRSFLDQS